MPSLIAQIRLTSSHPQVYEPCDDSFALVDALLADRKNLLNHRPSICMEVGSGSGYVITSLALILQDLKSTHYFATDINPLALKVTQETLQAHGPHAELITTNIAAGLDRRLAGTVDVMVVNPPYVPTPEAEVGCDRIAAAWAGVKMAGVLLIRFCPLLISFCPRKGGCICCFLRLMIPCKFVFK